MAKKGLVVVHAPNNLYQFCWYYCNIGKNKEWDALCLPNETKGEYMHTYCEKSKIFSHVISNNTEFFNMKSFKKLKIFLSMIAYFAIGQRKRFCVKMLNSFVSLDDYDELVVIGNVGIVTGACVALSDEKQVTILEDGLIDYGDKPKWIHKDKISSVFNLEGFILSKMGYCSPGAFYFQADKNCIKYASVPEKMIYRNYKEIRQLFDEEGTDRALFGEVISRIYPELSNIDFDIADAVFFTRPLNDYVTESEKYIGRLEKYVNGHYNSILLKRHPREQVDYCFADRVSCTIVDENIPAEVILPYLKNKDVYVISGSAVFLNMKALGIHFHVISFDGLYEESLSSNSMLKPMSDKEIREFCDKFAEGCYDIMSL